MFLSYYEEDSNEHYLRYDEEGNPLTDHEGRMGFCVNKEQFQDGIDWIAKVAGGKVERLEIYVEHAFHMGEIPQRCVNLSHLAVGTSEMLASFSLGGMNNLKSLKIWA